MNNMISRLLVPVLLAMVMTVPSLFPAAEESSKPSPGLNIPALQQRLQRASNEERVGVLAQLAQTYLNKEPKKSVKYAQQALTLTRALEDQEGIANALLMLCRGHDAAGDFGLAVVYGVKGLRVAKELDDKQKISDFLETSANALFHLGDYEKALENMLDKLKLWEETDNELLIAHAINDVGVYYRRFYRFPEALKYYSRALKRYEKIGNKLAIARTLNNIAGAYAEMRNHKKAIEYFRKALKMFEELGEKEGVVTCFTNMGMLFQDRQDFNRALDHFSKALKLVRELGNTRREFPILTSMGLTCFYLNQKADAVKYMETALKVSREVGDQWQIGSSLHHLSDLYERMGNFRKAEQYKDESLRVAKKIDAKDLENMIYHNASRLYIQMKDYKKAFEYQVLFHKTDTTMTRDQEGKRINQLQIRFDAQKKEREITLLQKEKNIRDLTLSNAQTARNWFIAGFILMLVLLVMLFKKYLYLFAFWKKQRYFGSFRLTGKIGSGAMGTVYRAHSIDDKSRTAAVKILNDELSGDKSNRKRFKQEAVIIDKLEHPHIVKIIERGDYNRQLFTAMELLQGRTLEDKINQDRQVNLEECLHIMVQIAAVVTFIHNNNVVHRDLKPDNVMLVHQDRDPHFVKLLDFGLARMELRTRLTQSGNFIGTLAYMAPEQVMYSHTSPANDIFSMGVIFYRMLSGGQAPFEGNTVVDLMGQIIKKQPFDVSMFNMDIPQDLNLLVMAMLLKDPRQRPSTHDVHQQLMAY